MGEPPFPAIVGALANALYRATGNLVYDQPFLGRKVFDVQRMAKDRILPYGQNRLPFFGIQHLRHAS